MGGALRGDATRPVLRGVTTAPPQLCGRRLSAPAAPPEPGSAESGLECIGRGGPRMADAARAVDSSMALVPATVCERPARAGGEMGTMLL